MKKIITVQHTESIHHINGMVGSWTDWKLTNKGKEEAKKIALHLKEEIQGEKFTLFSSDLIRAKQTAEPIADVLGINAIFKKELRERNLGKCCGKSIKWLKDNLQCKEVTIDDKLFSDAESRRDEWNRLTPFFNEIMESHDENIIIVLHGDLLSVFNTMFLGLPIESLNQLEIWGNSGGVSHMYIDDEGKKFIKMISNMEYVK